ncbi:MAG: hypothetical protein LBI42_00175 [Chitinispirillales bacterium]|nr:hypothetical protein [Chitinispirillales bacterium]
MKRVHSHETTGHKSSLEVERKFRPYLEHRVKERRAKGRLAAAVTATDFSYPAKNDFLSLWRVWDELSPEFHALYKEATAIPKDYDSFISPKKKFRVFYTTSGRDSVDITDKFCYGSGQYWNIRSDIPNGVPDYIDEAAFALDSSYTMIVERFGFDEPLPVAVNGSSEYYSIVIARQAPGYYGITHLDGRHSTRGWRSSIEINSDWSGSEWAGLGYDKDPYAALRVTCSHELFHAVQYATVWNVKGNVYLDDFPLGWTEGSATLMEDLAFPEVKDYLQYISQYFENPRITLLERNIFSDNLYVNSILLKYLYERTNPEDSIGFLKSVYDNNSASRNLSFHENLEIVSQSYAGKTFAQILNGFHAESYFTGNRTQAEVFITDSPKMMKWTVPAQAPESVTRTVQPYGAEFLWYIPQLNHPNMLNISLNGQTDNSVNAAGGKTWAASALVMEQQNNKISIVPVYMEQDGKGKFTLEEWKDKKGVLIITTNASPYSDRGITVKLETGFTGAAQENVPVNIFPNVISLKSKRAVRITGSGISDVKIYAADGKLVGYWNNNIKSASFQKQDDGVEWTPISGSSGKLAPGTYFIATVSRDQQTSKNQARKIKIMIVP